MADEAVDIGLQRLRRGAQGLKGLCFASQEDVCIKSLFQSHSYCLEKQKLNLVEWIVGEEGAEGDLLDERRIGGNPATQRQLLHSGLC